MSNKIKVNKRQRAVLQEVLAEFVRTDENSDGHKPRKADYATDAVARLTYCWPVAGMQLTPLQAALYQGPMVNAVQAAMPAAVKLHAYNNAAKRESRELPDNRALAALVAMAHEAWDMQNPHWSRREHTLWVAVGRQTASWWANGATIGGLHDIGPWARENARHTIRNGCWDMHQMAWAKGDHAEDIADTLAQIWEAAHLDEYLDVHAPEAQVMMTYIAVMLYGWWDFSEK